MEISTGWLLTELSTLNRAEVSIVDDFISPGWLFSLVELSTRDDFWSNFVFNIGDSKGGHGSPVQKSFLKIVEERLQYRFALLLLAFSIFLASILSHFQTFQIEIMQLLGVPP